MAVDISPPPTELSAGTAAAPLRGRLPLILTLLALALGLLGMVLAPSLLAASNLSAGAQALAAARQHPDDPILLTSAIRSLEQARHWSPADPFIYRQLGQAYLLRGDATAAVTALEEAYRLQPEGILVRQELAAAYKAAGRAEEARRLVDP